MYIYRRLRTSKSAVTIILIALALAAWGLLGPTGTTLAKKGKTTYEVILDIDSVQNPPYASSDSLHDGNP